MKWVSLGFTIVLLTAGCASKSEVKASSNAAFIAGQQQAWTQFQQTRPNSVRVLGPVRQPILEWTETLTVAGAIVAADYRGPTPRMIVVHRNNQAIPVDPNRLLSGADMPVMPGDTLEIQP